MIFLNSPQQAGYDIIITFKAIHYNIDCKSTDQCWEGYEKRSFSDI